MILLLVINYREEIRQSDIRNKSRCYNSERWMSRGSCRVPSLKSMDGKLLITRRGKKCLECWNVGWCGKSCSLCMLLLYLSTHAFPLNISWQIAHSGLSNPPIAWIKFAIKLTFHPLRCCSQFLGIVLLPESHSYFSVLDFQSVIYETASTKSSSTHHITSCSGRHVSSDDFKQSRNVYFSCSSFPAPLFLPGMKRSLLYSRGYCTEVQI